MFFKVYIFVIFSFRFRAVDSAGYGPVFKCTLNDL